MTQSNSSVGVNFAALGLAPPSSTPSNASGSPSALGQNQFLQLMIAQLKNQDPTQPLDSNQFLTQLAQFSQVTNTAQMTQSVQALSNSLQSSQALQASTLVGRTVQVKGSTLSLASAGASASGAVELPSASPDVVVTISDPAGAEVRRIDLGTQAAGQVAFQWDGRTDSGGPAPAGRYTVSAVSVGAGSTAAALKTLVDARVDSVSLNGSSGVTLNLDGVGAKNLSDIQQIL